MVVNKTGEQGSGVLSSMAEANCFIILPMENDGVTAGEIVEVQPFFGLM
jgi:molybdopterin molybdotransferase